MTADARAAMLRGDPYDAMDRALVQARLECRRAIERFNALSFADREERRAVLRDLVGALGEGAEVMAPFQCDYGRQITIGRGTFINYNATILDSASVEIGADVQIGPGVQLITALHPLEPAARRRGVETARPVRIEDGAWLAAGVIICPGVTVGVDAVIGAGSVVTRDMPAGHLCIGAPCRPMRAISGLETLTG